MGTYYIPRNVKGETRLFKIFSVKALIYTVICGIVGLFFKYIFDLTGIKYVGLVILGIFCLAGFIVGTFKVPNNNLLKMCKICGGENIDDIILRAIRFRKAKKIYINGRKDD